MSLQVLDIRRQIRNLQQKQQRLNKKNDPVYQAIQKAKRKAKYKKNKKHIIAKAIEWNKNHPEKVRLTQKRHREKHKNDPVFKKKEKKRRRRLYERNRKKEIARSAKWNAKHRDHINKLARERRKRKKYDDAIKHRRELLDMFIVYWGTEYHRTKEVIL